MRRPNRLLVSGVSMAGSCLALLATSACGGIGTPEELGQELAAAIQRKDTVAIGELACADKRGSQDRILPDALTSMPVEATFDGVTNKTEERATINIKLSSSVIPSAAAQWIPPIPFTAVVEDGSWVVC